jgi:hypothetical protein
MVDVEKCWDLVYDSWVSLDLERILAETWPLERRWQLDLLSARIERMEEAVTELAFQRLVALAEADNECVEELKAERANNDLSGGDFYECRTRGYRCNLHAASYGTEAGGGP